MLGCPKNTHTHTQCKMCQMKVTDRIHSKGNELCQFIFGSLNTKCWWWILLDPKSAGPPSFIKRFKSPAWAPKCSRCACVLREKEKKMRDRKGETIKAQLLCNWPFLFRCWLYYGKYKHKQTQSRSRAIASGGLTCVK